MQEFLHAITRSTGTALQRCELTFVAREPIDLTVAMRQHSEYCSALRERGVEVETLPEDLALPDAVFVEDNAIVLDEIAVIARPGSAARRPETAPVASALSRHRTLARIVEPGTLDGGDVLVVGRQCFVGRSSRSNASGVEQFRTLVEPHGYSVVPVGVHGCLHLKTAVTALDDETLLLHPQWMDTSAVRYLRRIEVSPAEPFAANALCIEGIVHLSQRHPRTRERVEAHGFPTRALDISEFEKAEAGLTCLGLLFRSRSQ